MSSHADVSNNNPQYCVVCLYTPMYTTCTHVYTTCTIMYCRKALHIYHKNNYVYIKCDWACENRACGHK